MTAQRCQNVSSYMTPCVLPEGHDGPHNDDPRVRMCDAEMHGHLPAVIVAEDSAWCGLCAQDVYDRAMRRIRILSDRLHAKAVGE